MRLSAAACPSEQLLIETDSPDLAPVLENGQRPVLNSPQNWGLIAGAAAKIRGEEAKVTMTRAHANLRAFLGLNGIERP
jgi:Tat protein secretion system quality control protein TatD with DNase activity